MKFFSLNSLFALVAIASSASTSHSQTVDIHFNANRSEGGHEFTQNLYNKRHTFNRSERKRDRQSLPVFLFRGKNSTTRHSLVERPLRTQSMQWAPSTAANASLRTKISRNSNALNSGHNQPSFDTRSNRPNIIFVLTDDQDIELGSMNFMPKTLRILADGGAHFPNAYVTTPMCCPSRSSILTGLYTHNHNVYTNNDNCSSPQWQREHETRTFATYLSNAGYRTAYFGKYLNEYSGNYIPPGWKEWSALIRNSRFYNYTLNINGKKVKHGDNYYMDYFPDLITNSSLAFLRHSKRHFPDKPFLMVLGYPSPHGPEDAAPQYQHLFHNVTTHRTASWDYAPNPDKQWLLRHTRQMEQIHIDFTDLLHTKRLQTLQSVDDAVEKLYNELSSLGELNNTYILYTSDHGYHLGQFGLVKGKSMPFEFDVRLPFYVRGPHIKPGISIRDIVLNIDIAPTFLDIAGISIPDHMDGKSFLSSFNDPQKSLKNGRKPTKNEKKFFSRDSFIIERGFFVYSKSYSERSSNLPKLTKKQWLALECRKPQYQSPCGHYQQWECILDNGEYKMKKCRTMQNLNFNCPCALNGDEINSERVFQKSDFSNENEDFHSYEHKVKYLDAIEKRLQRRFLKEHVKRHFRPVFINSRSKREIVEGEEFDVEGVYNLNKYLEATDSKEPENNETNGFGNSILRSRQINVCRILSNNSVMCPNEIYQNNKLWRRKKERVDNLIKKLQLKLELLKGIRRHLKWRRPSRGNNEVKCECDAKKSSYENYLSDSWRFNRFNKRRGKHAKDRNSRKKVKKLRRKIKFENTTCNFEKMNCFTHDNNHWKTAPFWSKGPFCFCQNSNNNTFWCLRTINTTHNFLYCEFVTGFLTYYDLRTDPFQLRNMIYSLDFGVLETLHKQLLKLKTCKGWRQCTVKYGNNLNESNANDYSDEKADTSVTSNY
ncbi:hypothetical protein B4U79_10786, partial [Dinothrombium tinctorium]